MPSTVRRPSTRSSTSGRLHPHGRLIVLEGPDGGGKSTQAKLLVEALEKEGRKVVLTREPGGTPLGERLRDMLLEHPSVEGQPVEIGARAELFLFMAARAQLVEAVIVPALQAGKTVVTERFLMSSVVYQGLAGTIPAGEVEAVGHSAIAGLVPDLTVVVDVETGVALARTGDPDRIEQRGGNYRERVRQGFLSLASRDRVGIAVVDGARPVEEVHAEIMKRVRDALG